MPFTIIDQTGRIVTAKITGELSRADVDEIHAIAREAIQRNGKIAALFFLDEFRGWMTESDWSDLTFLNDKNIDKIAVVGEVRWKEDVCAFLAKGFRHAAVEFFSHSEPYMARQWLKSSAARKS